MAIFGTDRGKFGFKGGKEDDFDIYGGEDDFGDVTEDEEDFSTVEAPAAPAFTATPVSLKIISLKSYDDAKEITDFLMNGNTILLTVDSVSREVALRIIDHLRGAVQVLGGMITRVNKSTIVVAPKNVEVSSIEAMVGSAEQ